MEPSYESRIQKLRQLLSSHRRILVLGGAGLSTESGLLDFRSDKARAHCHSTYGHPVEVLLSRGFFESEPETFYACFRELLCKEAKPNRGHLALAKLEEQGRLLSILTQNVDGLHQKAGCRRVLELHGNVREGLCLSCGRPILKGWPGEGVPRCPDCGGLCRPDMVLYDEALNEYVLRAARARMFSADLLLIVGTSLSVFPAGDLPQYYTGRELVIINRTPTPLDQSSTLRFFEDAGQVLGDAVGV
ncbi:MAG: NAD-dependent protein deacylase [Clostridia bacterium]|nr:NAD-dependent protein deacylase [Clostridia bacterium]